VVVCDLVTLFSYSTILTCCGVGGLIAKERVKEGVIVLVSMSLAVAQSKSPYNIEILAADSYQLLGTLVGHYYHIFDVDYSRDERYLASASGDMTVRIWDLASFQEVRRMTFESMVLRVCYDSTGHFLIVALNDGYLMKYDAEQGGMLLNFKASDVSLTGGISFTPDDSRIVTRTSRKWSRKHDSILVWDGMSGELLSTFAGHHTDSIKQISVCPVGNLIASAAWDKTVVILDSTNGAQISRLDGHTDLVYAVAYNADGTLLASAAADRTVKIWSGETYELLHTLATPETMYQLSFSGDGTRILCAHHKMVVVLDASTGEVYYSIANANFGRFSPQQTILM
jgi:WD40 repeat protein